VQKHTKTLENNFAKSEAMLILRNYSTFTIAIFHPRLFVEHLSKCISASKLQQPLSQGVASLSAMSYLKIYRQEKKTNFHLLLLLFLFQSGVFVNASINYESLVAFGETFFRVEDKILRNISKKGRRRKGKKGSPRQNMQFFLHFWGMKRFSEGFRGRGDD
jgi:hypothetical protein